MADRGDAKLTGGILPARQMRRVASQGQHRGGVDGDQGSLFFFYCLGNCRTHFVQLLAYVLLLLFRHIAHSCACRSETSFFPKKTHAGLLKVRFVVDVSDRSEGIGFDFFQFSQHGWIYGVVPTGIEYSEKTHAKARRRKGFLR